MASAKRPRSSLIEAKELGNHFSIVAVHTRSVAVVLHVCESYKQGGRTERQKVHKRDVYFAALHLPSFLRQPSEAPFEVVAPQPIR
jgi:hypothetical protein